MTNAECRLLTPRNLTLSRTAEFENSSSIGLSLDRCKSAFFPLFDIYPLDQEPQAKQDFPKARNLADCRIDMGKKKEYCTIYQMAEASNHNYDTEYPGKESRLENQIAKGEEPKAPKHGTP